VEELILSKEGVIKRKIRTYKNKFENLTRKKWEIKILYC